MNDIFRCIYDVISCCTVPGFCLNFITQHRTAASLIYQLRDYQNFVDSIPEELRKELMERYEQKQGEQTQTMKL